MLSDEKVAAYRAAYAAWQRQLTGLHEVLLDGKRLDPVQLKGLLNRESRAKGCYDRARRVILRVRRLSGRPALR